MLLCKTSLRPSRIAGLGLFAEEEVKKGQAIWIYHEGFDLSFTGADLEKLPEPAVERLMHYTFHCSDTGNYILCADDARFMNHAASANTSSEDDGSYQGLTVASTQISIGEEITCDYFEFDLDARLKLS